MKFAIRSKLVAIVSIAALSLPVTGCTPQQQTDAKVTIAKIAQYIPEVTVAGDTLASVFSALAPQYAGIIQTSQATFDAAQAELGTLCATYIATPSDGTLSGIRATLTAMLSTNADEFFAAAKITDPASQASAKLAIGAVRTLLLLMDGLLQQTQTPTQNAAAASARTLKLSEVAPYLDKHRVELATGHKFSTVMAYEQALGY